MGTHHEERRRRPGDPVSLGQLREESAAAPPQQATQVSPPPAQDQQPASPLAAAHPALADDAFPLFRAGEGVHFDSTLERDTAPRLDPATMGALQAMQGTQAPAPPPAPAAAPQVAAAPTAPVAPAAAPAPTAAPPTGAQALANPTTTALSESQMAALRAMQKPPRDEERQAAAMQIERGLPSEASIDEARQGEGRSRILHAIGAGLMGYAGRPAPAFESHADALAAERRAGLRTGATQQAALSHQMAQDARAERQLAVAEQRAGTDSELARSLIEQRGATTERTEGQTEAERTAREARASATSDVSRGYQQAIDATLRSAGPFGERFRAGLTTPLEEQSADQLEPMARRLQSLGLSVRGLGGAGGGGSGAGMAQLRQAAVAHGVAEDAAQVLSAADLRREIGETQGPTARAAESRAAGSERGVAILPGVYADPEIVGDRVSQRQLHTQIVEGARHLGALRRVRSISEQFGRTGALDPRAEADVVAARSTLMSMVAQLENSGIIGPSDMPRVLAAVPNPSDFTQANLGTLAHRLDAFQQAIDEAASISLSAAGVTDAGLSSALRFMHTGRAATPHRPAPSAATPAAPVSTAGAPAAPATGGRVRVRMPDGSVGTVPEDRLQDAIERGAEAL